MRDAHEKKKQEMVKVSETSHVNEESEAIRCKRSATRTAHDIS